MKRKPIYTSLYGLFLLAAATILSASAPVKFAWLTDTHVSGPDCQAAKDLSLCIADINSEVKPDFVLVTGDLTDFGTDSQIALVKSMLDSLNVPYYTIPGNHDAKWSESGCNTFVRTFGYEQFDFMAGGYRFLGCASGPNMRMAPALIPRSDMVWLNGLKDCHKTIFVNHYPMDSSVLNYFDYRKVLRRNDARIVLGGHWHKYTVLDYDGVPGILGRSSLSTAKLPAGYSIVTIKDDTLRVSERRVMAHTAVTMPAWYTHDLSRCEAKAPHCDKDGLPDDYPWLRYDVNDRYPSIHETWRITEDSDIASGFATDGKKHLWYATCSGKLRCISTGGKRGWTVKLPGRIFSTPIYSNGLVIVGCAGNGLYAYKAKNGRLVWKADTEKSVLASPAVCDGKVYFGASDGKFRAVNIKDGSPVWTFDGVGGFVEDKAWADKEQVVFGAWDRSLYSLDASTGRLMWKWTVDKGSVMYSPAACWPVKSHGRIFVAVPDRKVYAIDAKTGKEAFHLEGGREAVGMSEDCETIYAKSMHSQAYAFKADATAADDAEIWRVTTDLHYDISPTALEAKGGLVYLPTDKGNLYALNAADGSLAWAHKISVAMVNPLTVVEDGKGHTTIYASTMDGVITRLDF